MFSIYPFFFSNDTATTEIYTLSLHDALPISHRHQPGPHPPRMGRPDDGPRQALRHPHARLRGRHRRRSEEHTSELQSQSNLVCRLLLEKKKKKKKTNDTSKTKQEQKSPLEVN